MQFQFEVGDRVQITGEGATMAGRVGMTGRVVQVDPDDYAFPYEVVLDDTSSRDWYREREVMAIVDDTTAGGQGLSDEEKGLIRAALERFIITVGKEIGGYSNPRGILNLSKQIQDAGDLIEKLS